MKRTTVTIGVAAAVAAILAACGGHDDSGGTPPASSTPPPTTTPPSTSLLLTTNEFLMGYAEQPSDTAAPHAVNAGALGFSDTSETSTPISVNGS